MIVECTIHVTIKEENVKDFVHLPSLLQNQFNWHNLSLSSRTHLAHFSIIFIEKKSKFRKLMILSICQINTSTY